MKLPDNATDLAVEDLASIVLEDMNRRYKTNSREAFNYHNETTGFADDETALAFAEAWSWLDREGLIVPRPSGGSRGTTSSSFGWFIPSRRGRSIDSRDEMEAFARERLLPRG